MKIKINSDGDLPSEKMLNTHNIEILLQPAFNKS